MTHFLQFLTEIAKMTFDHMTDQCLQCDPAEDEEADAEVVAEENFDVSIGYLVGFDIGAEDNFKFCLVPLVGSCFLSSQFLKNR